MIQCVCCNYFEIESPREYCGWCVDCPTEGCDVPRKEFKKIRDPKEKGFKIKDSEEHIYRSNN